METVLNQLDLLSPASEEAIKHMLASFGIALPQDYLDFLRHSNGATGHGPELFVNITPVEKVHERTLASGAAELCPGLIVIGSDGCGNIIGIDARSHDRQKMEYVVLDPVWLDLDSESCQHRSRTLQGILEYLANRS